MFIIPPLFFIKEIGVMSQTYRVVLVLHAWSIWTQ